MKTMSQYVTANLIRTYPPTENDVSCPTQYHIDTKELGLPEYTFLSINRILISGSYDSRVRFYTPSLLHDITLPPGEFIDLSIKIPTLCA